MENNESQTFESRIDFAGLHESATGARNEISKAIVGLNNITDLMMVALMSNGHVLLEGVPGVAKTLLSKSFARIIDAGFSRIQFTPDLMPSDVTGTNIFNPEKSSFTFRQGPIFSNIILIDEINRAPAKTQSALFEVMEERQVTYDHHTYVLNEPFMVVATQNPVEQEGTYRLPEAQLDRFMFKLKVGYPNAEEETAILMLHHQTLQAHKPVETIQPVITQTQLVQHKANITKVHVEPKLIDYIVSIMQHTRTAKHIYLGASPRAAVACLQASKALAALRGRDFVTPDDIQYILPNVLRHRIILTPEREMEGASADDVIKQMLEKVEVPR